ncbi:NAD(P)-dependent oxidoreductase [Paraglaciecola sp. 20A4]|uniref:NAD-dependent epimerase/dehydratase family protein n=1 Tax=Paraglaciecola sp. 20A4 TaxID=2687288 RepID=UPI00140CB86F|nr:NAD(P)-dependent oxidoreductase [Paraglaciecola sp. 20A4]
MDKIFIAGGTGMLGASTARAFADKGIQVIVSSRKDNDVVGDKLESESDLIKVERVDLFNSDDLDALFKKHKFSGLVMLAHTHQYALTRDKNNEIYPITINCLEMARKHGVKRVVFGGSLAVYGGLMPPFSESVAFPPEVPAEYVGMPKFEVAMKRALEIIALDYGQDFQMGLSVPPGTQKPEPHELEVVILRAPSMFGPGYKALGSPLSIAAHVAAGKIPQFKGNLGYKDVPIEMLWGLFAGAPVSYVKDNAQCIQIAMGAKELKHHIYNVCSGFTASPRAQLQSILNVAPECADQIGLKPSELPEAPVEMDAGFNSDLFEKDFGWKSSFTLETAFADYVRWLKDNQY